MKIYPWLGCFLAAVAAATVFFNAARGAAAAVSDGYQISQEHGGPITGDALSESYRVKAEIGHPGVGASISDSYLYQHGTWWAESLGAAAPGGKDKDIVVPPPDSGGGGSGDGGGGGGGSEGGGSGQPGGPGGGTGDGGGETSGSGPAGGGTGSAPSGGGLVGGGTSGGSQFGAGPAPEPITGGTVTVTRLSPPPVQPVTLQEYLKAVQPRPAVQIGKVKIVRVRSAIVPEFLMVIVKEIIPWLIWLALALWLAALVVLIVKNRGAALAAAGLLVVGSLFSGWLAFASVNRANRALDVTRPLLTIRAALQEKEQAVNDLIKKPPSAVYRAIFTDAVTSREERLTVIIKAAIQWWIWLAALMLALATILLVIIRRRSDGDHLQLEPEIASPPLAIGAAPMPPPATAMIVVAALAGLLIVSTAAAAIPRTINYQSRLRDRKDNPITSATALKFSLYRNAAGGSALWSETYDQQTGLCAKITPDSQGYVSLQLGSCEPFPINLKFTEGLYLGVTVGADSEAAPRVPVSSFSYSLNASRLGGFVDTNRNAVLGEATGEATAAKKGYDSPALIFQGSGWDGSAAKDRQFSLKNVVSDADNYRFSIFDDKNKELLSVDAAGRLGVGTAAPSEKLDVVGNATISGSLIVGSGKTAFNGVAYQWPKSGPDADGQALTSDSDGNLSWKTAGGGGGSGGSGGSAPASGWTDDGSVVRLTTKGDLVGIGTNTPTRKLEVVGETALLGSTVLGERRDDDISLAGRLISTVEPKETVTYDLGSDEHRFKTLFVEGVDLSAGKITAFGHTYKMPTSTPTTTKRKHKLYALSLTSKGTGQLAWQRIPIVKGISGSGAARRIAVFISKSRIASSTVLEEATGSINLIAGTFKTAGVTRIDAASGDAFFGNTAVADLSVGGSASIGDSASDVLTVNARLDSHFIPAKDKTYNLGSDLLRFDTIFGRQLSLSSGNMAVNGVSYVWPAQGADADGQVLSSDVSGNLSWKTVGGGDSSGGSAPASGWTDDGSVVRLTTSGDSVGIGVAAPDSKLHVVGDITVQGDLLAKTGNTYTIGSVSRRFENMFVRQIDVSATTTLRGIGYLWPDTGPDDNQVLAASADGALSWKTLNFGDIFGSGTAGRLSKFTGKKTLGDSLVEESGGNLAVVSGDFNVSAGAVQTNGVTRIANDGAATFGITTVSDFSSAGNIVLGDGVSDDLTVTARLISDVEPKDTKQYNLGAAARRFATLFADKLDLSSGDLNINGVNYLWPSSGAAASGQSLTSDTSGNLSWKTVGGGANDSGWTDDGSVVRLTTTNDQVGIGTASPGARLHVPWLSGDQLPAGLFGSADGSNNQIAVRALSGSAPAIKAESAAGAGVIVSVNTSKAAGSVSISGTADGGIGILGTTTGGSGLPGRFIMSGSETNNGRVLEVVRDAPGAGPLLEIKDLKDTASDLIIAGSAKQGRRFSIDSKGNLVTAGSGTFGGAVKPDTDVAYDLGDPTHRWRSLFVGGRSVHIGQVVIGERKLTNGKTGLSIAVGRETIYIVPSGEESVVYRYNTKTQRDEPLVAAGPSPSNDCPKGSAVVADGRGGLECVSPAGAGASGNIDRSRGVSSPAGTSVETQQEPSPRRTFLDFLRGLGGGQDQQNRLERQDPVPNLFNRLAPSNPSTGGSSPNTVTQPSSLTQPPQPLLPSLFQSLWPLLKQLFGVT